MSAAGTEQRKLAAIMFTDMVGYSALAQRNEQLALELLEEHRRVLRSLFPRFNGIEIKTIGDAFLVEFGSALEAAQCAIEIQRSLTKRNTDAPTDRQIQVRIGIHIGDVIHREGDVLGDGVNIASRIEQMAGPSGICISMDVERQIRHALEAALVKLPAAELKNIQVPMDLFRIVLPWEKAREEIRNQKSEIRHRVRLLTSAATRTWRTAAFAVLALAVGLGGWFYRLRSRSPTAAPVASLAVLPFENRSQDPADEYLSDGMTDELISTLQQVRGLKVQGRGSSFYFKGKKESFRRIGEQLQVTYLLEGSVSKSGNKLRVAADLVSAADGFQLWATNYDREMVDIFVIRSDVAQQVTTALKLRLGVADTQRLQVKPTENLAAYDLYLKGRFCLYQYTGLTSTQAISFLNQAIALDPNFAKAYAGLAATYAWVSSMYMSPREAMPLAKRNVEKALALDESLAEAHHANATIKLWADWDFQGAELAFGRSLELNPNEAQVYCDYVELLVPLGRFPKALEIATKAAQLSPADGAIRLAWVYRGMRRHDQEIAVAEQAVANAPNHARAHQVLALAYLGQGKRDEAVDQARKALELAGEREWYLLNYAVILGRSGRTDEARKCLEEINLLMNQKKYFSQVSLALLYESLGEHEQAFAWLQKAYEDRCDHLLGMRVFPEFDSFRGDPRFSKLLKTIGLEK